MSGRTERDGQYVKNAVDAWVPEEPISATLVAAASTDQVVAKKSDGTLYLTTVGGGAGGVPAGHPDALPGSPDAMDDEMNDDTGYSGVVNGLDAQWTWANQGAATITFTDNVDGRMIFTCPSNGSTQLRYIHQAMPAGACRFRAKVSARLVTGWNAGTFHAGLYARKNSAADGEAIVITNNASGYFNFATPFFSADTTHGGTVSILGIINPGQWVYLEFERDGSGNISFRASVDGEHFGELNTGTESGLLGGGNTLDQICLMMNCVSTTDSGEMLVAWFRRMA